MDAEAWFSLYAKIRTKEGRILPSPKPNALQERVFAHYRRCQAEGRPCLIMILKPRQKGASTIAEAVIYHHMRRIPELNGLIMGDVAATSQKVFEMFQRYAQLDQFPWPDGQGNIAPDGDYTESTTLTNGSKFSQETAGSTNAGRSGTVQVLHLDEVAFFQKASNKDPTTAVLGSFAKDFPVSLGFATSTANGASGWFYNTWNNKDNDWHKIFAAWFEFADSETPFRTPEEREQFEKSMTDDEHQERDLYKVTLEQLHWRRRMINTDYEGDIARFRQEMPSNDTECFLLSASPRFHMPSIRNMENFAKANGAHERGNLVLQNTRAALWIPDGRGNIKRFEEPRPGFRYIQSIDTCSGEDQQVSGMSADRDWHACQVWRAAYIDPAGDFQRPKLVARHKSRDDTDVLAETAAALSWYYGGCFTVPEVNGMAGIHIVKQLLKYRVPLFRRKPNTHQKKNQTEEEVLEAFGWMTDRQTKKWIIDHLAPLIRKEDLDIRDLEVIEQLKTFIITDSGSSEAMPGKHDDEVIAAAIALYCMNGATEYRLGRASSVDLNRLARDPRYMAPNGFKRMAAEFRR